MPSTDSHPCLPQSLLDKLKSDPVVHLSTSYIFKPELEEFRHRALKLSDDRASVEVEVVQPSNILPGTGLHEDLSDNMGHFRKGDRRTFLHFAARNADLPLAYEFIRMGIIIDYKDKDGITALFLAMDYLLSLHTVYATVSKPGFARTIPSTDKDLQAVLNPTSVKERSECVARIITLLIEQHADVNAGAFGQTPLSLAVELGDWTLAELLLRHGARRPRIEDLKFSSSKDKKHFASILNIIKGSGPRPARPCPCWSGKLLSECHDAESLPYPAEFLCGCGKRRTYGACCGKRGVVVEERWDQDDKWIMPLQVRTMRLPEVLPEFASSFSAGLDVNQKMLENMNDDAKRKMVEIMKQNGKGDMLRKMLRAVGREDDIDPAFMHALNNTDFFARPWEGQISKVESQKRMNEWNGAVDRYIATKTDPRPRFDIELEAKIGPHGGPLYRECEAENCDRVEGRDVEKLKCCGSCKLVFYCSQTCQVDSWKDHKKECKNKSHRAQQLPSQWTLESLMTGLSIAGGMKFGGPEGMAAMNALMGT